MQIFAFCKQVFAFSDTGLSTISCKIYCFLFFTVIDYKRGSLSLKSVLSKMNTDKKGYHLLNNLRGQTQKHSALFIRVQGQRLYLHNRNTINTDIFHPNLVLSFMHKHRLCENQSSRGQRSCLKVLWGFFLPQWKPGHILFQDSTVPAC